jgi:hypothetical protein
MPEAPSASLDPSDDLHDPSDDLHAAGGNGEIPAARSSCR